MTNYNKKEHLEVLKKLWSNPTKAHKTEIEKYCQEIYPYETIPNVSSFRVKILAAYHPILAEKTNVNGNYKSQVLVRTDTPEFEYELGSNSKLNKYLKYMFKILNKNRSDSRIFWNLGLLLLGSSIAFRISCLKRILPKWYKSERWSKVKRMFKKYKKLDIQNYIYKQVFIPKTDGSLRPLGVPSPEWRLLLAGLNMLLLTFLSLYQHPNQHGYLPNKGTESAWSQMDEEILSKGFIYDFDLMKFFDSVDLTNLRNILISTDMPLHLVESLIGWNRVPPQNAETSTSLTWESNETKAISVEQYSQLPCRERSYYESLDLRDNYKNDYNYYHGVAQGSYILFIFL